MAVQVCFDRYKSTKSGYIVSIRLKTDVLNNAPKHLRIKLTKKDVNDIPGPAVQLDQRIYAVAKAKMMRFAFDLASECNSIQKC